MIIDRSKVYTYFDKYHGGLERSTNGWYACQCPSCGKRKLAVHLDRLQVKCWKGCYQDYIPSFIQKHNQLKSFRDVLDLIASQNDTIIKIPKKFVRSEKQGIELPPGYRPLLAPDSCHVGNRAKQFLLKRGFNLNYLDMRGIGYCVEEARVKEENYFGYIIIPFYEGGKLVYFIGRDFVGNFLRYKNPPKEQFGVGKADVLFNGDALHLYDKVYITEGWSDAAIIGKDGISTQGLAFSPRQINMIIKSPVSELVIIPDAGAYKEGLKNARKFIGHKRVRVMSLDHFKKAGKGKDVNEIGWDLVKPTQYDFEYLTSTRWYRLMRQA